MGLEEETAQDTCSSEDTSPPWLPSQEIQRVDEEGAPLDTGTCSGQTMQLDANHVQEQIMKLLQQMMGQVTGQPAAAQRMAYVSLPRMLGDQVCTVAELLQSRRWDLLHGRMRVIIPQNSDVRIDGRLLEAIAGMAEQHVVGQCQNLGKFKMDHLACFLPGVLALGVMTGAAEEPDAELELAAGLAETCAQMWLKTPSGLAPESAAWNVMPHRSDDMHALPDSTYSSLRPETVESLWYLYMATGDRKYQDWGWEIFNAIVRYARVETGGFSGIENVWESISPRRRDRMETFLLSETFKYLFLLFADGPPPFDLTKVVLNTEAHPLPVFDAKLLR